MVLIFIANVVCSKTRAVDPRGINPDPTLNKKNRILIRPYENPLDLYFEKKVKLVELSILSILNGF